MRKGWRSGIPEGFGPCPTERSNDPGGTSGVSVGNRLWQELSRVPLFGLLYSILRSMSPGPKSGPIPPAERATWQKKIALRGCWSGSLILLVLGGLR
jgi:hypothetical protein